MAGAIEALDVLPCASVEDIEHNHDNVAVAFRFQNSAEGILELPEIPNAGILTIHVRNGNSINVTTLDLEKFENNVWTRIHTFDLIPSGALRTSIDEVLNYNINSATSVKLRLRNSGIRYINLYRVSVGSYGVVNSIETTDYKPFTIIGRKLIAESPVKISVYNVLGVMVFEKQVENEIELPAKMGKGIFIINSNQGTQKVFLSK